MMVRGSLMQQTGQTCDHEPDTAEPLAGGLLADIGYLQTLVHELLGRCPEVGRLDFPLVHVASWSLDFVDEDGHTERFALVG